ncbi:MAG: MBL fold metallo-hydrolase [Gemmatimonadaceae bacterium]
MLLQRFYHDGLAQASYLIGSPATGEAIVVDANRNIEQYVSAAAAQSLRITHVTETHIHADYVSGSRALAATTRAELLLSGEGGQEWSYTFAEQDGARLLHDGDAIRVGDVQIDVLHTPGHTPEHLTFVVRDLAASDQPLGALTGDFLFVGDVGRPDLLERAAGLSGTMQSAARTLFRSLERFAASHPDYLQIWPAHGAGSACGKSLGAVPMSTLGYEKLANWALAIWNEDAFVDEVLAGQPDPPAYFAIMKRTNRGGPALLGDRPIPPRQAGDSAAGTIAGGAVVVDLRGTEAFAAGGLAGSFNIPFTVSFLPRTGALLPYDRDVYLVPGGEDPALVERATSELALIGIDSVRGWYGSDAFAIDKLRQRVPQLSAAEVAQRLRSGGATVVDVRNADEWSSGHIPGAVSVPLARLTSSIDTLRAAGQPLVLHCQGGGRSAVAASVLLAAGLRDVANMTGGFAEWEAAGLPSTKDTA